jgi:ABC-type sugar transport system permease subunit
VIKDSDKKDAKQRVTWATYKEYFGYSRLGIASLFLLVFYHLIINLNSISVGLYLAFTLSNRFNEDGSDQTQSSWYNIILSLIMISSIVTTFLGKYLSNKIVSLIVMILFSIVHGNQPENS